MVKVAHESLKSQPIITGLGTFEVDANGAFDVADDIAAKLCANYGKMFHLVGKVSKPELTKAAPSKLVDGSKVETKPESKSKTKVTIKKK